MSGIVEIGDDAHGHFASVWVEFWSVQACN